MGESTAKFMDGRTAAPPRSSIGSHASDTDGEQRTRWRQRTPFSPRARRGPRVWFEILLIAIGYWVYSLVRNSVPERDEAGMRHAHQVWDLEQSLGLGIEYTVNHAVNSITWLIIGMNYYYATFHFIVTLGVLVWLFRKHPAQYASIRLVLFVTTGIALVGYYSYPLAPPRFMRGEGHDFVDTVKVHHTWGSMASGDLAHVSNQYAAMPSMHIGWSLWCGITIAVLAKPVWVKVLGLLYPVTTLFVIISTANHFWLDAVGGTTCLAFGFAVAWAVAYLPAWARIGACGGLLP